MGLGNHILRRYFGLLPISAAIVGIIVFAVSSFQLTQQYAYHLTSGFDFPFSWLEISLKILIGNVVWAILAPLLLLIGRRASKSINGFEWSHFSYFLYIAPLAWLQNSMTLWLYNLSFYFQSGYMRDFFGDNNRSALITGFFTSLLEGLVIVGIFMAIIYQKKLATKERDLAKAALAALKMQLHPHFLFNTLHSISSMIDIDIKKAQRMITKVGDLLRNMLTRSEDDFVTVEEEIDFIRNYLELEQIRFQDRMEIEFHIEEGVMKRKLPSLILQPLVENCIKHGVSRSTGQNRINVNAVLYQNGSEVPWLRLEIQNSDNHPIKANTTDSFGIGLKNVEMRLKQNYGERYYCRFEKLDDHHYQSELRIPMEE